MLSLTAMGGGNLIIMPKLSDLFNIQALAGGDKPRPFNLCPLMIRWREVR